MNNFQTKLTKAVEMFNEEYLKVHPCDWDCCGFVNIMINFGRKRKLKEKVEELGFTIHEKWAGWGNPITPNFEIPHVGHQALTYLEDRTKVIIEELIKELPELDGLVSIRSVVD